MKNIGVTCDVCECSHNVDKCKCSLQSIEITHQTDAKNAVETPHFCKNYECKNC